MDPDDVAWYKAQLHSPDMQCRQCELAREILTRAGVDIE